MSKKYKITRPKVNRHSLRAVELPAGLPEPNEISAELEHMFNVLIGREEAPLKKNTLDLMEIADAYYMRASELTFLIHRLERQGTIARGSDYYKLRTGEIEDFREACKRAVELGSRRLTHEQLEHNQIVRGLASEGME